MHGLIAKMFTKKRQNGKKKSKHWKPSIFTNLDVLTKETIIEVNVSDLGYVNAQGNIKISLGVIMHILQIILKMMID